MLRIIFVIILVCVIICILSIQFIAIVKGFVISGVNFKLAIVITVVLQGILIFRIEEYQYDAIRNYVINFINNK